MLIVGGVHCVVVGGEDGGGGGIGLVAVVDSGICRAPPL